MVLTRRLNGNSAGKGQGGSGGGSDGAAGKQRRTTGNDNASSKSSLSSSSSSAAAAAAPLSASKATLLLLFAAYAVVFSLALASLFAFKPSPLPSTSAPTLFSEENAMRDVVALAGGGAKGGGGGAGRGDGNSVDVAAAADVDVASIKRSSRAGERQLATPGCDRAAAHLEGRVAQLAEAARAAGLDAEWGSRLSAGGVDSTFLHFPYTSVFLGVRNVVLRLSPRVGAGKDGGVLPPAVLVGSHYDSALGSPGAADAAVPISVALEVARVVVEAAAAANNKNDNSSSSSSPSRPPLRAPLLLLLNGGEESLMLGSAAFMLEEGGGGGAGGGDAAMEALELSMAPPSASALETSSSPAPPPPPPQQQQQHWRDSVGAVLNLESTGADGPHFMFQHAGAFPLRAWRKGSARPRGTVIAQDFFDAGLSPAATDFECFAAPSPVVLSREKAKKAKEGDRTGKGSGSGSGSGSGNGRGRGLDLPCSAAGALPGLDVALMLGAEVYHTFADSTRRLRPGTVQAMGDDAVGVVWELAGALADATEGLLKSSSSSSSTTANASSPPAPPFSAADVVASLGDPAERSVYFDVLGLVFVSYSRSGVGMWLHTAPLVLSLALALVFVSFAVGGDKKSSSPLLLLRPWSIVVAVAAASLSAVGTVSVPALLGAALAMLTRRPMGWFGAGGGWGLLAFVPAAAAGALWPYSLLLKSSSFPPSSSVPPPLPLLSSLVLLGAALTSGAASVAMALAGYGSCYVLALWSLSAAAASLVLLLSLVSSSSSSSHSSDSSFFSSSQGKKKRLEEKKRARAREASEQQQQRHNGNGAGGASDGDDGNDNEEEQEGGKQPSPPAPPPSLAALSLAVAFLSLPAVVTSPDALVLALHILQKASFAGAPLSGRKLFRGSRWPLPLLPEELLSELLSFALSDAAAAAVVGASVLSAVGAAPALAASAMMTMTTGSREEKGEEGQKKKRDADVDGKKRCRRSSSSSSSSSPFSILGRVSLSLAAVSATVLVLCAFLRDPHSPAAPKKVFVQLFHRLSNSNSTSTSTTSPDGGGAFISSSRWLGAGVDAVPSAPFLPPALGPWRSTPGAGRGGGVEWLSLFPLGEILETSEGKGVEAAVISPPPTLTLLSRSASPSSSGEAEEERLVLALDVADPSAVSRGVFGALNVTGTVLRWSLTPSFSSPLPPLPSSPPSPSPPSPRPWRIVRFGGVPPHVAEEAKGRKGKEEAMAKEKGGDGKSGDGGGSPPPYWRFWVDVPKGERVSVSGAVSTVGLEGSEVLDALFGDSVSATLVETWGGQWEF